MRRDAREAVYRILYAEMFNDTNDSEFIKEVYGDLKLTESDARFADDLLAAIDKNRAAIEAKISEYIVGYSIERLDPTVKCALLLAFAELKYFDDIPSVVSIDEAVTLVRRYATADGINFTNGILAAYKKNLEETNENY